MWTILVVVFCSASGGATFGFLLVALLTNTKMRDLEHAYEKLSHSVHDFLSHHPANQKSPVVVHSSQFSAMEELLKESDEIAGLNLFENRHY